MTKQAILRWSLVTVATGTLIGGLSVALRGSEPAGEAAGSTGQATRVDSHAIPRAAQLRGSSAATRASPQLAAPDLSSRGTGCDSLGEEAFSYEVEVTSDSQFEAEALGLPDGVIPETVKQTGRFSMDLLPVGMDRDGTVLLGAFRDLSGRGLDEPALAKPFLMRVGYDCQVRAFAHHESTTRPIGRRQQALLFSLAWRFQPSAPEAYHGANSIGFFQAHAHATAEGEALVVHQEVAHYERLWERGALGQVFELVPEASEVTVRLTDEPWFESFEGREVLGGEGARVETTTAAVAAESPEDALTAVDHDLDHYVWADLLPETSSGREPREVTEADLEARAAVAHLTADQSVDAYIHRVASGVGIADTWPALTHYLEARPDAASDVLAKLKAGEVPAEATAGIYIALGRARTPQARQVLRGVVDDAGAPAFERTRAMFAMIDRDDVDVDFARNLASLAGTGTVLERESLLALGALAGLQKNAQITAVARGTIEGVIEEGGTGTDMSPAFGALANLGDPSMLPHAERASRHRSYRVRQAAAITHRRLRPSDSEELVADWLARETHPDVKRRLYHTTFLQTVDTHEPIGERVAAQAIRDLATMPDVITRKSIVRLLGTVVATMPEAREALMAQLPLEVKEKRAGLYEIVAQQLDPQDVRTGLGL